MTSCALYPLCGGCRFLELDETEYRKQKCEYFAKVIKAVKQPDICLGKPVFIASGTRRRAAMAFSFSQKKLRLGFNAARSNEIVDCHFCALLTERLNRNLEGLHAFLTEICAEPCESGKGRKVMRQNITGGDILLCDADNGIDITLEIPYAPTLAHRMIISEYAARSSDVLRVSWRHRASAEPETMLEKTRPVVKNGNVDVYIPAGTFLQASREGERALINLVKTYLGTRSGKIADLFCGVGTFSYPLAENRNNRILAIDSSAELLDGFRRSVNSNQIPNIEIRAANLFKYPLEGKELADCDVVVFDPPRAGAAAQVAKIAAAGCPQVVIAVSCNPHTFVNDANTLIAGGYALKEVTMVDQFVYSGHTELVALFEKEK